MRILVSNDDGIDAPGIRALAQALIPLGEIVVVAPDRQRSAASHSISLHGRLYVDEVTAPIPGTRAYAVSGTPVDCVKWAAVTLGSEQRFDMMVSGINEGPNLATDVLYSGTVAAAGEASLLGIPAVALSLIGPKFPFTDAALVARRIVEWARRFDWPPDTFLNVNMPPECLAASWQVVPLGARGYHNIFRKKVDPSGRTYYRHAGEAIDDAGDMLTDTRVLQAGGISLTPLIYRFTNESILDSLGSALRNNETKDR